MRFLRRWRISGTLTSRTPFRIGNGGITTREELKNDKTKERVEISAVATHDNKRAYIPGSTLKGDLRAWAKVCAPELIYPFFGSENAEIAGTVQFHDAPAVAITDQSRHEQLPYWCSDRLTAVITSVMINRRTRTASDKKLFHQEYVPPGIIFALTLSGNDYDTHDDLTGDAGLEKLLALLEGFNKDNGVTVGAEAESLKEGWGRLTWELTSIKRWDSRDVENWIDDYDQDRSSDDAGYELLKEIDTNDFETLKGAGKQLGDEFANAARPSNHIAVSLTLDCKENFIVNDPSQTGDSPLPNHAPLIAIGNRPLLPHRSIKGAVRSQAEKIIRTMGGYACYPENETTSCKPVNSIAEAKLLCLACQLFGASGWRSPFQCTPFVATAKTDGREWETERQEFVAIDRFTGGGADGRKFNAESFYRPQLEGQFSLDLQALENIGAGKWTIGLLALTLRDLIEGDIRIGMGAAKGYGSIEAKVIHVALVPPVNLPSSFRSVIDEEFLADMNDIKSHEEFLNSLSLEVLGSCVDQLPQAIADGKKGQD